MAEMKAPQEDYRDWYDNHTGDRKPPMLAIRCTCSGVPPTMPTCRPPWEHLDSCPWAALAPLIHDALAYRWLLPEFRQLSLACGFLDRGDVEAARFVVRRLWGAPPAQGPDGPTPTAEPR